MKVWLKSISISAVLPYLRLALFLIGAKFALIAVYGNATPYWDQWDAEASLLYRPWIEGSLSWFDMLAPHNEHRILTTRLLALLLFEINAEKWDPIIQMQVNTILHILSIFTLLFFISKSLPNVYKTILFIFSAILFSIPYGWENTLSGFQSQFYLLLLFSFVFLWIMSTCETYSLKWWVGFIFGLLCLFTLASGVITVLAGVLITAFRKIYAKENKNIAISALALLLIISIAAIVLTPSISGHGSLKAQSISQFLVGLATVFSWPIQNKLGVVIIQIPLLFFMLKIYLKPIYRTPVNFFIFAMGLWLLGQFASMAYGRAATVTSSRYLDIFAIGLAINFSVLLILLTNSNKPHQIRYRVGMVIWLLAVSFGFAMSAGQLAEDLRTKAKQGLEQEKNVRAYICSGDIADLKGKEFLYIPYPNADRLQEMLDNSTIRSILPGNVYGPNSTHPIATDGEPFCDPGKLVRPYELSKWEPAKEVASIALENVVKSSSWLGTDYFKSEMPGYKVIGSLVGSENDTGTITLHLRRGDSILYRSGPRVSGQFVLINNGGLGKNYTNMPTSLEWTVLTFSSNSLPETFDVTFIDGGTKWGEWSAIALKKQTKFGRIYEK
jgi:hypothetical protein